MELPPRSLTPPRRPARPLPQPALQQTPTLGGEAGGAALAVENASRRRPLPPSLQTAGAGALAAPPASHEDPLGLGMARTSQRQLMQPSSAASPDPQPASPLIKRPPPSLPGLSKKPPPPLAGLQKATLESKYSAARSSAQGELQVAEVKAFLEAEGVDVDDAYVRGCMQQFDADGNGTLSLDEFHVLVTQVTPTLLAQDGGSRRWDMNINVPKWDDMKAKAGAFADLRGERFPLTAETWRQTSPSKQRAVMAGCACWCLALVAFLYSVGSVLLEEDCVELGPKTICSHPASVEISSDVEPAVDIVFIDDRSSSMVAYEDHNAGNYQSFIVSLVSNSSALRDRWRLIVANSADGCHTNDGSYLSVGSPSALTAFHRAAASWRGDLHPYTEALMVVAQKAIEESRPGGCNEGFLREHALLHIILVSDAQTPYKPMLDSLVQAKGNDTSLVTVSVFRSHEYASAPYRADATNLNVDQDEFDAFSAEALDRPGFGYEQAAAQSGGVDGSVASNDWRHACYERIGSELAPVLQDCTHGYDINNVLCTEDRVGQTECPQQTPTAGTCVHLDEGAAPPAPPVPTDGVCSLDLSGRGGDEGYQSGAVGAGQGGFSLDVVFTSYSQRDQLIVCRGACPPQTLTDPQTATVCDPNDLAQINCVVHDSGCIGTTNQHSYIPFPTQNTALEIEIQVMPNCQGGRGTAWVLGTVCTPEPPPPPPTPVFSPARPACDYSSRAYDLVSMSANTITIAVPVDDVIFPDDIVRLVGAPGLPCAADSEDLVVDSVVADVVTLGTAFAVMDSDPGTNCKLLRKVPKCDSEHTAPIVRDGFDFEQDPQIETEVCYRDLVEELAIERKAFGRYPVPTLPGYKNYTNLQLYVGSARLAGPRVLADGSINPMCTAAEECKWTLQNPTHRAGEALVKFEMLQEELAELFLRGQQLILLRWDENNIGGCVVVYSSPCPEGHNPLLYILFLLLLVLICLATYKSVVRKHAVKPPPVHMINVKTFSGEMHEIQISEGMTISDVKSLLEKISGVPLEEIRLFHEEYSQNQLDGQLECSACGLIAEQGSPPKTLTMMVTWTIYVREESVSTTVAAKMQELGIDVAVKVHVVEGVEKHWKIESVKRESRNSHSSIDKEERRSSACSQMTCATLTLL